MEREVENEESYEGSLYSMAVSPSTSGVIVTGTDKGVFRSNDYGKSWIPVDVIASTIGIPIHAINLFLTWAVLGLMMMISLKEARALFDTQTKDIFAYALVVWVVALFYAKPEDLVFVLFVVLLSALAYNGKIRPKDMLPLAYPLVSYLFIFSLYVSYGMKAFIWLMVIVISVDIGAYITGKKFGKTKFSATSPNKTIEGVAGGIVVATILGSLFVVSHLSFFAGLLISFVVAISSIFGDLFESYLKRQANVKDSGDIFPGHGGMLDRADGYLFAGIILVVLLRFSI